MKEFEFIKLLKEKCKGCGSTPGIGDDAALFDNFLVAKDIVCEGIHFLKATPAEHVVLKVFSANISDIAAMGGTPKYVLLGIAVPKAREGEKKNIIEAIKKSAGLYDVEVIGGDTASASNDLFVSLTVIGKKGRFLLSRSGAGKGERVYLSRPLGLARISLEKELGADFDIDAFKHYKMMAEKELGEVLGNVGTVTSCIDISDGLGRDASHLSEESGVKIVIEEKRLPFSHLKQFDVDKVDYFINSGEEFALLFTAKKEHAVDSYLKDNGFEVHDIGYTQKGSGVFLSNGAKRISISSKGYEHK
ncbi:thiamine-monophosphate kinase [Flexistipes sinusarabici DSM 4947]|uniref:Thiamine-monophosphate kinase n=1 Tax=Flexistipes sinusarabici (strain ATCC 49648 / DSM 4947 / MAS 10) TaxID=717231 RepID=F8E6U8_FLESM|nr:thiamine-phosphate kinase [Flexistipes sinusarabici]AEI13734.1 thiamine-monophosphate kinase [Flexistipes sinusarabici DSM 4947]